MRVVFEEQLDGVRKDLIEIAELVQTAVNRATVSLLEGDAAVAEEVISADSRIDELRERVENECYEIISLQAPVATDLRTLIAALKMAGEYERMGDLAVHVAKIARMRVPDTAVPERLEPGIARMASLAEVMVGKTAQIIEDRDVEAAQALETIDEEMDKLRRKQFKQMFADEWSHGIEPAVDVALLGRYYERIADHAVSIARRVIFLATGEMRAHDA